MPLGVMADAPVTSMSMCLIFSAISRRVMNFQYRCTPSRVEASSSLPSGTLPGAMRKTPRSMP